MEVNNTNINRIRITLQKIQKQRHSFFGFKQKEKSRGKDDENNEERPNGFC